MLRIAWRKSRRAMFMRASRESIGTLLPDEGETSREEFG
jgi:hypothetical protein